MAVHSVWLVTTTLLFFVVVLLTSTLHYKKPVLVTPVWAPPVAPVMVPVVVPPLRDLELYSSYRDANSAVCIAHNDVKLRRDGFGIDLHTHREWSMPEQLFPPHIQPHDVCRNASGLQQSLKLGKRHQKHFVPHGCRVQWYTPQEACEVISQYSDVVFAGDSLVRHTVQGLWMALSGDWAGGGLPHDSPKELYDQCVCDGQFSEHIVCRNYDESMFNMVDVRGHRLCHGQQPWSMRFYNAYDKACGADCFADMCHGDPRDRLVLIAGGLHFKVDANNAINSFIEPTLNALQQQQRDCPHRYRVHVVWVGLSVQVRELDAQYPHQSRERALVFNKHIEDHFMARRGFTVTTLDVWNMTEDAASSDGQHFLSDVNLQKAMYVVNLMQALQTT